MSYFSAADLNLVRSDPSKVTAVYTKYHDDFLRVAGLSNASEGIRVAAFCSVVAYDLKPYGASSALTYDQLLASDYLSCAQYVRLTMRLTEEFGRPDIKFDAVGWDYGNAVPNHSHLFVYSGGQSVLLDPTIGLIVRNANLPNLAYGVGYRPDKFVSFYDHNRTAGVNLDAFNAAVQAAIASGAFKHQYGIRDASSFEDFASRGIIIGDARSGSHLDDKFVWSGTVWGGRGNDNILGRDGNDFFSGGEGNDRLAGGAGKDTVHGDSGNDLLIGGAGRDLLFGGADADRFRFDKFTDSRTGSPDVIRDFEQGLDKIVLAPMDADINRSGDQAFKFLGSHIFTGHAGELRSVADIVYGDVNGDKVADFAIKVLGISIFAASDFIL